MRVAPYWKAVAAGVASGVAFAIPVVDDGLLPSEVLGIVLAVLTGAGVTWAVPNRGPSDG